MDTGVQHTAGIPYRDVILSPVQQALLVCSVSGAWPCPAPLPEAAWGSGKGQWKQQPMCWTKVRVGGLWVTGGLPPLRRGRSTALPCLSGLSGVAQVPELRLNLQKKTPLCVTRKGT